MSTTTTTVTVASATVATATVSATGLPFRLQVTNFVPENNGGGSSPAGQWFNFGQNSYLLFGDTATTWYALNTCNELLIAGSVVPGASQSSLVSADSSTPLGYALTAGSRAADYGDLLEFYSADDIASNDYTTGDCDIDPNGSILSCTEYADGSTLDVLADNFGAPFLTTPDVSPNTYGELTVKAVYQSTLR